MAYIEPRGKKFIVVWREAGKRHSKGGFTSKRDARLFKNEIERRLLEGTLAHAEDRKQPFGVYARKLFESDTRIRAKTRDTYLWALGKLEEHLGSYTMEEVQPARVRAALASIHQATSAYTVDQCHAVLSRVFRQAVADGILHRNPLDGARRPKKVRRPPRILTPEEVGAIADAIEPRFRLAVLISAWGGLRIGEVGGLQRQDLDFDANTVAIRRAVSTPNSGPELGPPKSDSSIRVVTLPAWVMQDLRRHLLQYPGEQVFTLTSGALLHHSTVQYYWRRALKAAGLSKPWPRFHDLRHTAVALAIRQGAHPKRIQARMGHSSITMTMDTYGHLFPSDDAELAAGLEKFRPTEGKVIEL